MIRKYWYFWLSIVFLWAIFSFPSQILLLGKSARPILTLVTFASFIIIIYSGVLFFRDYRKSSELALQKILKECEANKTQTKGSIPVSFFIYVGFINTLKTVKVDVFVDKVHALALLKKLRNFNFRWGLLGAGALFVPFSTMYNYFKQKQRILKAAAQ